MKYRRCDLKIEYIETSKLIPYARNNKTHNERQIKLIAASIKEFGFKNPVVVDKENVIIAGHGRVLAAERIELDKVPCVIADDLTKAQIKAYRIADNKLADLADYDEEMLSLELEELQELNFDIELTGISDDELNDFDLEEDITFSEDNANDKFNFIISCENIDELRELQNKLNTDIEETLQRIKIKYKDLKI